MDVTSTTNTNAFRKSGNSKEFRYKRKEMKHA